MNSQLLSSSADGSNSNQETQAEDDDLILQTRLEAARVSLVQQEVNIRRVNTENPHKGLVLDVLETVDFAFRTVAHLLEQTTSSGVNKANAVSSEYPPTQVLSSSNVLPSYIWAKRRDRVILDVNFEENADQNETVQPNDRLKQEALNPEPNEQSKIPGPSRTCEAANAIRPKTCGTCNQLVGCRQCVARWYHTANEIAPRRAKCPLCRGSWIRLKRSVF